MMDFLLSTVSANNACFRYLRFGKGSRNFVIIPGLSIKSVLDSAPVIVGGFARFADDFTVYLIERRKDLPEGFKISDLAEDEAAAMKALGIESTDIFGASLGGIMAQYIALDHPELVHAAVLASTTPQFDRAKIEFFGSLLELAVEGRGEELFLAFAEFVYSEGFLKRYKSAISAIAKSVTADELGHFVKVARAFSEFDITDRLPAVKCPVLAVGATGDRILGAGPMKTIAEKIPGSQSLIYEGGSHACYDEEPGFRARMYEFLRSQK